MKSLLLIDIYKNNTQYTPDRLKRGNGLDSIDGVNTQYPRFFKHEDGKSINVDRLYRQKIEQDKRLCAKNINAYLLKPNI